MTQDYPRLVEVYEKYDDGEKGGWAVKPSFAQASRRFEAESRAELEAGLEELTAVALAEGWEEDTPSGMEFAFSGDKEFPAGSGSVLIRIGIVDGTETLLVDLHLN